MNPEHEMLVDKLKGHNYKMSPFQYMEVRSHIDAEMMYIVGAGVDKYREEVLSTTHKTWKAYFLFKIIAKSVHDIMSERENFKGTLIVQRTINSMLRAINSVGIDSGMADATDDYLMYAVLDTLNQIRYGANE